MSADRSRTRALGQRRWVLKWRGTRGDTSARRSEFAQIALVGHIRIESVGRYELRARMDKDLDDYPSGACLDWGAHVWSVRGSRVQCARGRSSTMNVGFN